MRGVIYKPQITPHCQKGVTLVGALFIIVIMALLGTGLLQLFTTSQQSVGQEITSVKAYFAAHSALQWSMYEATYAGGASTGSNTLTFSNAGLANTTADTDIQLNNIEGRNFYTINASGYFGSSTDREYSQRTLQLRFQF
jgi:MSHA biogenesis protein MshP